MGDEAAHRHVLATARHPQRDLDHRLARRSHDDRHRAARVHLGGELDEELAREVLCDLRRALGIDLAAEVRADQGSERVLPDLRQHPGRQQARRLRGA